MKSPDENACVKRSRRKSCGYRSRQLAFTQRRMRTLSFLLALAFLPAPTGVAQPGAAPPFVSSARRLLTAPELKDAPDEWIDRSLQWVNFIFENYPPALTEHPVRRAALIRLDDVFHIQSAPGKPLVQRFYRQRMERAVSNIEKTEVTEGLRVWKLYNLGFLLRSPSVSFAFDIVPGPPLKSAPDFQLSKEWMHRLVSQSDALFISHEHDDHANPEVARLFLDAGKPVIAPEGLWTEVPDLASRLTYPRRSVDQVHWIPIQKGKRGLKVIAFPGHQGTAPVNNVHLVTTPEGICVMQTGDQSGAEGPGSDFDWITQIGRNHKVAILLPNCWGNALDRTLHGINPELVVTGHENEMAHAVDHREDYTQTYNRLFGSKYPAIVMAWGESYLYRQDRSRNQK